MIDYEKQFETPAYATKSRQLAIATTFKIVYGWMCLGLAVSGLVAWFTAESGFGESVLTGGGMMICIIAELALVFTLSAGIRKLPVVAAYLLFLAYSAVNGLTLSVIFLAYDLGLVARVFFITAGMFGGLAVWGSLTKGDLSSIGSICGMAVWGLIIGSLVNLFVGSSRLDHLLTFVGIIAFTGLTMYDAQKVKEIAAAERTLDGTAVHKAGIMGALSLYLDFINLFLYLLRFFGKRN